MKREQHGSGKSLRILNLGQLGNWKCAEGCRWRMALELNMPGTEPSEPHSWFNSTRQIRGVFKEVKYRAFAGLFAWTALRETEV